LILQFYKRPWKERGGEERERERKREREREREREHINQYRRARLTLTTVQLLIFYLATQQSTMRLLDVIELSRMFLICRFVETLSYVERI